jgi:CRISPR-associated protein, Csh2 family
MSDLLKNRREILFLYDVSFGNPNGDPNDLNKPRIDEETGKNIVTDVRLKRTVRDYLMNFEGFEIFVKEIAKEDGSIQDAKARAKDFNNDPDRF